MSDGSPPPSDVGMVEALRDLGLIGTEEVAQTFPLSGGVSADVFGVRAAGGGAFAVKRAIPRLRVRADWRAPVERIAGEVAWLTEARAVEPRFAPEVLAVDTARHLFVMPWLNPADHPVWKTSMAGGLVDPAVAAAVGRDLARIHSAMAGRTDSAAAFADGANFSALRIDPFLLYTADQHPDVAPSIRRLAHDLTRSRATLIHGDVSPKNILAGPGGPVFLDAETAGFSDGAFDLAFCLTHLLLKTLWLASHASALMASYDALREAYFAGCAWDGPGEVSARAAPLVGALLLARVDGKSPAGYLSPAQEDEVRQRAKAILAQPNQDLELLAAWWRSA
jgi:5-methylthioribose kinase